MISIGAGEDLVSEYRSVIFYHSGKPEWVETIKVRIKNSILLMIINILFKCFFFLSKTFCTKTIVTLWIIFLALKTIFLQKFLSPPFSPILTGHHYPWGLLRFQNSVYESLDKAAKIPQESRNIFVTLHRIGWHFLILFTVIGSWVCSQDNVFFTCRFKFQRVTK